MGDDICLVRISFPQSSMTCEALLTENRIFKQRTLISGSYGRRGDGLGLHRADVARVGVAWDLRKAQPYDVYDRMEFRYSRRQERRLL